MAFLVVLAAIVVGAAIALARARERALQRLEHDLRIHEKFMKEYQQAQRLRILRGLLLEEKCRGCARMVPRDDIDQAGEDSRGRPIRLCSKCRKLIGLD